MNKMNGCAKTDHKNTKKNLKEAENFLKLSSLFTLVSTRSISHTGPYSVMNSLSQGWQSDLRIWV